MQLNVLSLNLKSPNLNVFWLQCTALSRMPVYFESWSSRESGAIFFCHRFLLFLLVRKSGKNSVVYLYLFLSCRLTRFPSGR